jgi:hypothetical protein
LYDERFGREKLRSERSVRSGAAVRTRLSFAKRESVDEFSVLNFAIIESIFLSFGRKGSEIFRLRV